MPRFGGRSLKSCECFSGAVRCRAIAPQFLSILCFRGFATFLARDRADRIAAAEVAEG